MDYRQILTDVIISSKTPIVHGKTIIIIWKDAKHLQEWYLTMNVKSDSVRIASVPSEFMTIFDIGNENRDDVCIIALVFGIQQDYSDACSIFHMVVKNK